MHRRPALRRVLVAACAVVPLAACDFAQDKDAAASYADRYFAAAASGDVAAVLPLYSPRFFSDTSREGWIGTLRQVRERCGAPSAHELRGWRVTHNVGTGAGTTARLVYDVRYERCRMTETLLIFRPPDGDFSVTGHTFELNRSAPAGSEKTTTT